MSDTKGYPTHPTADARIKAILNPGITPEEGLSNVTLLRQVAQDGLYLILARRREKEGKERGDKLRLRILSGLHELGLRGVVRQDKRLLHVLINLQGARLFPIEKGILKFLGELTTRVDAKIVIPLNGSVSLRQQRQIVSAVEEIFGKTMADQVRVEFSQAKLNDLRRADPRIGKAEPFSVLIQGTTEVVNADFDEE